MRTVPPNSSPGSLVESRIAPPMVLRPNSVPCGPRSTCTEAMSRSAIVPPTALPMYTSSMYRPTPGSTVEVGSVWPMPRMNTCEEELLPASGALLANCRFGTTWSSTSVVNTWRSSSASPDERGDRDRRVLQVFLDLARGDDDFFEACRRLAPARTPVLRARAAAHAADASATPSSCTDCSSGPPVIAFCRLKYLSPDFPRGLDHQRELRLLLVQRERVAFFRRREAALRAQAKLLERHEARGFVDAALEIVLRSRAGRASWSRGRARRTCPSARSAAARSRRSARRRTRERSRRRSAR